MAKSKVLIISQNFYPEIGSAGNRMKNIFQLLETEGYDVDVLTTEPTYPNRDLYEDPKFWDDEYLNSKDEQVKRVNVRNRKYSFNMMNRLIYYIEVMLRFIFFILFSRKQYDVVFVSSPPIFIGFVGVIAKLRFRAKMILDIRDLWPESLKGVGVFDNKLIIGFFSKLETILYKVADKILVNSVGFIDYISEKASIDKHSITFIPNSAADKEMKQPTEPEGFSVIYTGNIGLAQDVDFLKELAVKLSENQVNLSVVGYGMKKRELVQFVKEQQLENVTFHNPMTREACLELNRQHHIGLITLNNKEVFNTVLPGKLIDYMSSNLPVVAAVSGHSKKLIEENKTGLVSETRSASEILEHILNLKNNSELRKEMQQNAAKLISDKFNWKKNIKVLSDLIIYDDMHAEYELALPNSKTS